ncbi:hypothetical protein HK099_003837 [Clydaea vesicula]|uniref:Uncharacterized protein n=1 Tax=Clydaea vesicula TaxID=447962 RepID=A0AAD5Y0N1_9FUNG|nr:hypothetical protein HK099_003837 [Clydaea vesicula]
MGNNSSKVARKYPSSIPKKPVPTNPIINPTLNATQTVTDVHQTKATQKDSDQQKDVKPQRPITQYYTPQMKEESKIFKENKLLEDQINSFNLKPKYENIREDNEGRVMLNIVKRRTRNERITELSKQERISQNNFKLNVNAFSDFLNKLKNLKYGNFIMVIG